MKSLVIVIISSMLSLASVSVAAQGRDDERRLANLMALSETALTTAVLLRERFPGQDSPLYWVADFDDERWSLTISNIDGYGSLNLKDDLLVVGPSDPFNFDQNFTTVEASDFGDQTFGDVAGKFEGQILIPLLAIQAHGVLVENKEEKLEITVVGGGNYGPEPIFISGSSRFSAHEDFALGRMDFSQVMKVGRSSWWGWIRGSELIVGGTVGAAGTVIASGMTGGSGMVIGLAGVLGGAASAVSVSDVATEFFRTDGDAEPSLPDSPELPEITTETPVSDLEEQFLVIEALMNEQSLKGTFPEGGPTIVGDFDMEAGTGSGEIE